jgi:alkyl sulfatase BDS1-like metallo-beta-lactamase superfamily hydrolase
MCTASEPSSFIVAAQQRAAAALPFTDDADLADAERGFIAALNPGRVTSEDGAVVWDNDSYAFLREPCPA